VIHFHFTGWSESRFRRHLNLGRGVISFTGGLFLALSNGRPAMPQNTWQRFNDGFADAFGLVREVTARI
jgi:hypothetical protein